jgi:2-dehydro-3-deoxygluconokinase
VTTPFDVIALGETMVSLIATDGSLEQATTFRATHGGAETNTLVALSRLGARTAWVSRLGDDGLGRRVERDLRGEGLDLRWVRRDPERVTGVMIRDTRGGLAYRREGSAASALSPDDLQDVPVHEARAVLVTGVTALIGDGPQRCAVALLEGADGLRVVDPNLRPGLWGSDRAADLILPLLERCDLLLGGEAELEALVGQADAPDGVRALAERCRAKGPSEVVVKRGAAGAAVLDADGGWNEHSGPPVQELDPVGAGDAFNAAYLHARLGGISPSEALIAGTRAGSAAAASLGDTAGAPAPLPSAARTDA